MRLTPIALSSLAGALLVACSETPATSTDTANTVDTTGDASTSTSSTSTPTTSTSEPAPTTSLPTTGDPTDTAGTTMPAGACGDGIVDPGEGCDAGPDNGPGNPCNSECQLSNCGDGEVGPGEQCDDGADNADHHSCTADCTNNVCGDGKAGPGEGCDDGNDIDDDACTNACALLTCGDQIVDASEQCDDGNDDDTDACTSTCTDAACSDGFHQPGVGEQCDDGPENADDAACTTECTVATCGDGHVWTTDGGAEECDNGPENGPGKPCNAQCLSNICGDGDPGPDEACDDGNVVSGDGCSATCALEACGNSVLDPGEQCDDGQNGDDTDACTDACKLPACGDGIKQAGEQCDLGGLNSNFGACTLDCKNATCGDGLVHDPIEQCDDGPNNGPGKACKANCTDNFCGDGDKGPGEACDDGNGNNDDDCTNACKAPTCGDGIVQGSEECDLGPDNANTGECTLACQLPECGDGVVQPGLDETCDDGNTIDNDGCPANCNEDPGEAVLEVVMGQHHTCALLAEGRVKCWGYSGQGPTGSEMFGVTGDEPGEMGDALPYVNLGAGVKALALASGLHHVCAIVTGGHVKCWGSNSFGQLGLGDTTARGSQPNEMGDFLPYVTLGAGQTATAITAGEEHTCVLLTGGRVKCWGKAGTLGLGDLLPRGNTPGTMGDNLPFVDLGANKKALAIDAGSFHTCAILDDNTLKCWGRGQFVYLGLGDSNPRGSGPGEMGDNLPAVDLGIGKVPVGVAAGSSHTCVLLAGGLVKCWGYQANGALGIGIEEPAIGNGPNEMGDFLPVVKLGQGKFAQQIAAGNERSCVILTDHRVKCWGYWYLGFDGNHIGDSPAEMGDNLPLVDLGTNQLAKKIFTNHNRVCVLLQNDRIKCWGSAATGGSGYGDLVSRGATNESMGDNLPFIEL